MLKWNYAVNLAIAGVLTVPMVMQDARSGESSVPAPAGSTTAAGLERSLADTLRALEVLSGIEKRSAAGELGASSVVRHVTEPALGDARERDRRLGALRDDVSRLQMLDDGLASERTSAPSSAERAALDAKAVAGTSSPLPVITTGLGDEARRAFAAPEGTALEAGTRPLAFVSGTSTANSPKSAAARGAGTTQPADPLRQGQACYRAGRYTDCLAVMKSLEGDVRARYWTARALEKLERIEEAILVYREVSQAPDAGYLATRAASDLDYLQWKVAVAERLARKAEAARKDAQSKPTGGTRP